MHVLCSVLVGSAQETRFQFEFESGAAYIDAPATTKKEDILKANNSGKKSGQI